MAEPAADTFGRYLKQLREAAGLTGRQLSAAAGMSESVVGQYESGAKGREHPRRATIDRLAAALQLSGSKEHWRLLELAGRLKTGERFGEPPRQNFEVYLRGDPFLTSDQRAALVAAYESYVRLNRARRS